jgi:predicted PurR-regulated permease PerM
VLLLPCMNKEKVIFSVSTGSIIKVLLVLVLFAVVLMLKDLVLVLLTAIIIASAIEPAASWFEHRRIPRLLAILFIYIIGAIVVVGIFYFILPNLFQEVLTLFDSLQNYAKLNDSTNQFSVLSWKPLFEVLTGVLPLKEAVSTLSNSFSTVSGGIVNLASSIFGGIISFIVVFVLSFYLAVQRDGVGNFLKIITPLRHESYVLDLWNRSQRKIGHWMQGQLLLSVIIGLLVYLGLTLLGVRDALILSLFAAICEFVPLFGPIIAAIPAVLFSYIDSGFTLALLAIGMYLVIHQLENQLIYPLVVRKIVGINPIVVIISLIAGYELAGFLGIVIAVPLATIGMEYLRDVERGRNPEAKEIAQKQISV